MRISCYVNVMGAGGQSQFASNGCDEFCLAAPTLVPSLPSVPRHPSGSLGLLSAGLGTHNTHERMQGSSVLKAATYLRNSV